MNLITTHQVKIIFVLVFPDAPTVSDLTSSQISKLADLLDTDIGWEEFAAVAFDNDNVIQKQVRNLYRHYNGGGNPVFSFLISLTQKYPMLTVKEFVSRCKSCGRNEKSLEDVKKYCERKELRRMGVALKLREIIDEPSVK